ncbi:MAG: alkaline phosphatase [Bacteroidales bacterium]
MKKFLLFAASMLIIFLSAQGNTNQSSSKKATHPKYVFLFIGDGMGLSHVSMAEAYLSTQKGQISNESISFTRFPVIGLVTTYSANSYITCSSAAGTAMSTGTKTNNYMLGVDPKGNKLRSISYKIHEKGIPVGIASSATIDHATPGAFYASSTSRTNYYEIAEQLPKTGFEFFGGGGFVQPKGEKGDQQNIYELISKAGYKIIRGQENLKNKTQKDKVVFLQREGKEGDLPYALDRKPGDLSLKEVVAAGIEHLYGNKGFFMMAEGGKIDWAAHSNDGKADILEVLDFADAIEVAYQFYLKHPEETLIIVTADHETGGVSLGREKGYTLSLKELDPQTRSIDSNKSQKEQIKELNNKANIGWTTTSHSGTMVPIYSIGAGSQEFSGRMDNTDIPRKITKLLNVKF